MEAFECWQKGTAYYENSLRGWGGVISIMEERRSNVIRDKQLPRLVYIAKLLRSNDVYCYQTQPTRTHLALSPK